MELVSQMPEEKLMPYFTTQYGIRTPGEISWSHAVNNVAKLQSSTQNSSIMFIESDIRMSPQGQIVTAHPPENESDLTIEHLIETMKTSKQGLKLDFKDPETVAPTLDLLAQAGLAQPVLLNADVLQGNGGNLPKFDPQKFIKLCREKYPQGILSLGWTTKNDSNFPYTKENVDEMIALTSGLSEITFPVRACLLQNSWQELKKLLEKKGRTFSIYNNEPMAEEEIAWIRENTDPARTFYDFIDENKDPLKLLS